MSSAGRNRKLSVFAPAKVNLFLHITGRRDDGYHELQSLIAFADIGDRLEISPADSFAFSVKGSFADRFTAKERDAGPDTANLAVRAVWELARLLKREPAISVILDKKLPLAAGLGGGSSDAAAALWGLLELWHIHYQAVPRFDDLMMALGADVPACFACQPAIAGGIGEILSPVPDLPEMPILLVNPGKACPTATVFRRFSEPFSSPVAPPQNMRPDSLIVFLREKTSNMLTEAAIEVVPDIALALDLLNRQNGCQLARLSGSGATCFGLFTDSDAAMTAAEEITLAHPSWWVRAGMLNRPERY